MAMPVVKGVKSPNERFAGALETYCIEALMQDNKALQAGTSHFLGQNFAKAFDVKFLTSENKEEYVWATSWGVSTRLMGALIMTHSDDAGLVLPPKLAPYPVVIVPIAKSDEEWAAVNEAAAKIQRELEDNGVAVKYDDDRTKRPGWKFAEWELKGAPVRITIGYRDLAASGEVEIFRRDKNAKSALPAQAAAKRALELLGEVQENLYATAQARMEANTRPADTWDEFKNLLENEGGFVSAHWDGTPETEELIKEETKATIRCIPLGAPEESGACVRTGKPSARRVLFALAY